MGPITHQDPMKYFSLNTTILRCIRLWFYSDIPVGGFCFLQIASSLIILFVFIVLPILAEIFYLYKMSFGEFNLQEAIGILNLVLLESQTLFKMADLYFRKKRLDYFFQQLCSPIFEGTKEEHQEIIRKSLKKAQFMIKTLICAIAVDITVHMVLVPAIHQFRNLPMKMDFLVFDSNEQPYYVIVFLFQVFYKPVTVLSYTAIETMPWVAMCSAIAQLDILILDINYMKSVVKVYHGNELKTNEDFRKYVSKLIDHHKAIIRFVKCLEDTFSGQFAITFVLAGIIMCTNAIQISVIDYPTNNMLTLLWMVVLFANLLFCLFISCWLANVITIKSQEVGTAVYGCPWLKLKPALKRSLLIFMARAQDPLTIMSGKMIPVSIPTFTLIINWTYKGFAVLNQMKN